MAKQIPHQLSTHGHVREDPYYWMNQRNNPEVKKYLEQENAHVAKTMAGLGRIEQTLFEEMKARVKEDDASVPYEKHGFLYYTKKSSGLEYPIFCRRAINDGPEEVLLDVNSLALGQAFTSLESVSISPDASKIAYTIDHIGRRNYTLHVIDRLSRDALITPIKDMSGSLAWSTDNKTLFYTKQDPETLRDFQLFRHKVEREAASQLVYEESDETFKIDIGLTKTEKFINLTSSSTLTTEVALLEADKPESEFKVFLPRKRGHEYHVYHAGHEFFILTNDKAQNFKIMKTGEQEQMWARDQWQPWHAHRDDTLLNDLEVFASHIVIDETRDGLDWLRIVERSSGKNHVLDFGEKTWAVSLDENENYDSTTLRYSFESMHIPESTFDYEMNVRTKILLKEQEIPSGYHKDDYITDRLFMTVRDDINVPVSMVYRKDTCLDGSAPLLLYAYGSYGASTAPYFDSTRLSLLDRGFIYAIAHTRGGSEMGHQWYEAGKLLNKKNTFYDFIDVAKDLVARKFTSHDRLYAQGASAGGLLVGAVINMAPGVFHGAIAEVPFVDIVTTMLDTSLPLTTAEYDEWGNPNDKDFYEYMLSYSPYDNVKPQEYPHLFVATGFNDSQVQYWEPAKWVARIRDLKTDHHQLLFKTNFDVGHGGSSGRFESLKEEATIQAFLLDLAGKVSREPQAH